MVHWTKVKIGTCGSIPFNNDGDITYKDKPDVIERIPIEVPSWHRDLSFALVHWTEASLSFASVRRTSKILNFVKL